MAPDNISSPLAATGNLLMSPEGDLVALALYVGLTLIIVIGLLLAARFLGQRTHTSLKKLPYECGVEPTGRARPGYPVPFYLTAIFFVVFDVEVAFIASWAVAYDLLSWRGLVQIAFFIITLLIALIYLWRRGALDWGPQRR
jgi:NADH-quinone oxidoreductase subunit A